MRRSIRPPRGFVASLALFFAAFAVAQDDEAAKTQITEDARADDEVREEQINAFDRTPESCISTSRIDRTEVIDDRTVIFHMRGRDVAYRNYLPRRCPNLARNDRFMYQVTSSRLCDVDTITVLEQFAGRLERGFTCGLGKFHPVTPEDIEELKLVAEQGGRDAIEAEPAELPRDEGDAE